MIALTEPQQEFIRLDFQSPEFRECLNESLASTDFIKTLRKEDLDVIHQAWNFRSKTVTERKAELTCLLLEHPSLRAKSLLEFMPRLIYLKQLILNSLKKQEVRPAILGRKRYVAGVGEVYIDEEGNEVE